MHNGIRNAIAGVPVMAMAANLERTVTFDPIAETDGLLSMVYNVEVCAVGIEYPLASGPATFTTDDLLEAVASQDDKAINAPRVWLGHPDDDRFHAGRATPAGSAEPALGKVVNMRVEDNGMTLVGDIAGCPTWLAQILSSAYPSRSIEGFQGASTATGHQWGLVITDLALLGVTWPGVSTLDDLQALYSEDGPDGVEVNEEDEMTLTAARAITAQVNVDDVRRSYYDSLNGDQFWWWIRAIQLDPNELIVDDDEGGLYRVPFTVKGEEVEFGEPAQVKIQYVNASQAKDPAARGLLVNMLTRDQKVTASWDKRTASRPDSTRPEEVNPMTPEQLRQSLGLPADATDDQVTARISELRAQEGNGGGSPEPAPEPQPAPAPGETPEQPAAPAPAPSGPQSPEPASPEQPEAQPSEPEAVAASSGQTPPGHVTVPAEAWAEVQRNAASGAAVAASTERTRRDDVVAAAIREGRIAPAQRDTFRTMFDRDAEGTNTLLTASVEQGGLMPGTIPVEARGADPADSDLSTEAYPAQWLPEVQAAKQADDRRVTMEA